MLYQLEAAADDSTDELGLALLESRQRWRAFGALSTDLAFETDEAGLLTFIAPDTVLGYAAAALAGTDPAALLLDDRGPNPFAQAGTPRRRVWLRTAEGRAVCMEMTTETLPDSGEARFDDARFDDARSGGIRSSAARTRGVGVDVTERERREVATAATLRRAEALEKILNRMRQEVQAPRMMTAMLEEMVQAFGSEGAVIADLTPGAAAPVLHAAGRRMPLLTLGAVLPRLDAEGGELQVVALADGGSALCCQCTTRFGTRAAVVTWRAPPVRPWEADDQGLVAAVTGVARIVLEHETIHRELARQARTDPLTGLLNRRAFLEETGRRLDRLERERLPGTLMFIDLDRLKQVNDNRGHEAGDEAITLCAGLLIRTFRPTDLVARLGGDEFAVWLDGADTFTAAERAEDLRLSTPGELGHLTAGLEPMGMSIGIATREPGTFEALEDLMGRADCAMYAVKNNGRGHWRVSQPENM